MTIRPFSPWKQPGLFLLLIGHGPAHAHQSIAATFGDVIRCPGARPRTWSWINRGSAFWLQRASPVQ